MTQPIMNVFIKSLYLFIKDPSGRGEIGKHKGLKTATVTGLVTRVTSNLLNYNNNLEDIISVAIQQGSGDLCLCRDITNNQQPIKTMSDIYETIVTQSDDGTWTTRHIWYDDAGRFSITDGCDAHEDLTQSEVDAILADVEKNNKEYAEYVAKTGEDPAKVYYVMTEKNVTANLTVYYQRWVGEKPHGLAVTTVRVLTGKYKGVYNPQDLPKPIADYLLLKHRPLSNRWVIDGFTKDDLYEGSDDITYRNEDYFQCRVEWKEPKVEATVKRELRAKARISDQTVTQQLEMFGTE